MEKKIEGFTDAVQDLEKDSLLFLERVKTVLAGLEDDRLKLSVTHPNRLRNALRQQTDFLENRLPPLLQVRDVLPPRPTEEEATEGAGERIRRVIPRYHKRLKVRYGMSGKRDLSQRGFSRDVGAMGLFIISTRHEKVGFMLDLEVELPNKTIVKMQGAVVWTKWVPPALRSVESPGFGLKITNAPESWFNLFLNPSSLLLRQ